MVSRRLLTFEKIEEPQVACNFTVLRESPFNDYTLYFVFQEDVTNLCKIGASNFREKYFTYKYENPKLKVSS